MLDNHKTLWEGSCQGCANGHCTRRRRWYLYWAHGAPYAAVPV